MSRFTTIDFVSLKQSKETYNDTRSLDIKNRNQKLIKSSRVRQNIDNKTIINFRDINRKKNISTEFAPQPSIMNEHECQLSIVSQKLPCLNNEQKVHKNNSNKKSNENAEELLKNSISNRYKLAPNLNLRKTVYLYKKSSFQEQNQKYYPANVVKRQKAYDARVRQNQQKKRKQQFLRDYELLTGFRTTLYQKTRKQSKRNQLKLQEIQQLVGQAPSKNKRFSLKVQDFTPWDT